MLKVSHVILTFCNDCCISSWFCFVVIFPIISKERSVSVGVVCVHVCACLCMSIWAYDSLCQFFLAWFSTSCLTLSHILKTPEAWCSQKNNLRLQSQMQLSGNKLYWYQLDFPPSKYALGLKCQWSFCKRMSKHFFKKSRYKVEIPFVIGCSN